MRLQWLSVHLFSALWDMCGCSFFTGISSLHDDVSNGNIFRVTGHLCGEFTGPRWIPHTKTSDAELWCLLWSAQEQAQGVWHTILCLAKFPEFYHQNADVKPLSYTWICAKQYGMLVRKTGTIRWGFDVNIQKNFGESILNSRQRSHSVEHEAHLSRETNWRAISVRKLS